MYVWAERLEITLKKSKAWRMEPEGTYVPRRNENRAVSRFQERFYDIMQAEERAGSPKRMSAIDGRDDGTADDWPT